MRYLPIGNLFSLFEFIRERPKAGAQHERDLGPQSRTRKDELGGGFRPLVFPVIPRGTRHLLCRGGTLANRRAFRFVLFSFLHHVSIPTNDADIRLAMVPASIARIP